MTQLLLVDDDPSSSSGFEAALRVAGYAVVTAASGTQALELLGNQTVDLVVCNMRLPDMTGLEMLAHLQRAARPMPPVIITGLGTARDAESAMRLGAADFLEQPASGDGLLHSVRTELGKREQKDGHSGQSGPTPVHAASPEAHAAARWARALMPIFDSITDPRTIADWSRLAYTSPGALRTWCRTAGVSPRRSLVFARLLRVVILGQGGKRKPENLLDAIDRRTFVGLLRFAGLNPRQDFPADPDIFLQRQSLVRDPDALYEVTRAVARRRPPTNGGASGKCTVTAHHTTRTP